MHQDFVPKLKRHILPRIERTIRREKSLASTSGLVQGEPSSRIPADVDGLSFKHNRMYTHNILRVNYTTYDVRRAQDTINPRTTHCNALFLAENGDNPGTFGNHPFLYGQILGIYHVNVIYSGPGMLDYRPRRVEFLSVRWFELLEPLGSWASWTLDHLRFPDMSGDGAFSFVDPANIVRGCHIIPRFVAGLCWPKDQSHCEPLAIRSARAFKQRGSDDWKEYCVNRYVHIEVRGFQTSILISVVKIRR